MLEVSAHIAAASASMLTLLWRLTTETKRFKLEWWMFLLGHLVNVGFQLGLGIGRM